MADRTAGEARAAILDAARRSLASSGRLSVQRVAADAGVSRQAVYYYFHGARGLRAALAEAAGAPEPEEVPTRERLLEAVQRVFSRPGGGLASIDAIAAEAGLSKGAIYHHFGDRAELIRAVARRVSPVDELAGVLEATDALPVREALTALASAYYAAMLRRAGLIRNLAVNAERDPELAQTVMAEIVGRGAPMVVAWLDARVARGELRQFDASFLLQALFGPVFLVIVLGEGVFDRLAGLGIRPAVRNVEDFVDLLMRGIAPASPPASPGQSVRVEIR